MEEKNFLVDFFLAMNFEKDYDSPFRRANKNFLLFIFCITARVVGLTSHRLAVLINELFCTDFAARREFIAERLMTDNRLSTAVDKYVRNYFLTSLVISVA